METNYLHEFVAFSKTLNYAQTAEALYLSQPTLRAHIKSLESDIGAAFVTKRAGRLELTAAGKMFLKKSYEMIDGVESALAECREYSRNSASLVVGDLGSVSFLEAVEEAKRTYNERGGGGVVEIRIATNMCSNVESLQSGDVDIVLFSRVRSERESYSEIDVPSGLEARYLKTVGMLFWVTKDSPLFDKQEVTVYDLEEKTLLLGTSRNMMAAGSAIRRTLEELGVLIGVDSCPFDSYLEYYVSGMRDTFGITHEVSIPSRPGIRAFKAEGISFLSDLYAIARVGDDKPVVRPFFDLLESQLKESFE